ncbi:MAG: GGDEF domain-containing protein [Vulcanimicrobiota bacterium]
MEQILACIQKLASALSEPSRFEAVTDCLQELVPQASEVVVLTVGNGQLRPVLAGRDPGLAAYELTGRRPRILARGTVMLCPLVGPAGQLLGALYLEGHSFTQGQADAVETVAQMLSLALPDPGLLPVYSESLFLVRLEEEIAWADRMARPFCLLLVDPDLFLSVNRRLGCEMGDRLLDEVADFLTDLVRASDLVARLEGDRFGLILREVDKKNGRKLANQLTKAFRARFAQPGLTASTGLAAFPSDGRDAAELWQAAEGAVVQSKKTGRARLTVAPAFDEPARPEAPSSLRPR